MNAHRQLRLGVNIDHIATVRQARKTCYPDPLEAALLAEKAGADGITVHLREDQRHIQPQDVIRLKQSIHLPLNMETAVTESMLKFILKIKPTWCCLVPEKRQELTTEGGLDVINHLNSVQHFCHELRAHDILVSLFIDPENEQIDAAVAVNANAVEIHTGAYADAGEANKQSELMKELARVKTAATYAKTKELIVNAGHGLHYQNVQEIAALPELHELNIGHSIVARALMVGMPTAVKQMRACMNEYLYSCSS